MDRRSISKFPSVAWKKLISELSEIVLRCCRLFPPVAPVAVALLTKTRKRNVEASAVRTVEGHCVALVCHHCVAERNYKSGVASRKQSRRNGAELFQPWILKVLSNREARKCPTLVLPKLDFVRSYSTSWWIETSCSAFCSTRDTVCSALEKFNFAKWQKVWKHEMHLMGLPSTSGPQFHTLLDVINLCGFYVMVSVADVKDDQHQPKWWVFFIP